MNRMKKDVQGSGKKRSKTSWVILAGYMLIGAACGIVVMEYLAHLEAEGVPGVGRLALSCLMIVCMYACLILQIIIHEAGHLVFGLATGYKFSSFRIFNLMLIRENGKLRLRRMSLAGTGGQCLMCPPDMKDGTMPFMLYNLGGSIMNLLSAVLLLGPALSCPHGSAGWVILWFLVIIGVAYAVINGFPLGAGPVNNDGRNVMDMMHSPEAVRAFWLQMKVAEMISRGVRVRDMPAEWFTEPSGEGMNNGLIAQAGALKCSRLMDERRFEEADAMMERMLKGENGLVGLSRMVMTCDRIFTELMGPNRQEMVEKILTEEQKKLMKSMKSSPEVLRTEYALALLGENNAEKAETIRKQFEKVIRTYPYRGEAEGERELMDMAAARAAARTPAEGHRA